MHQHRFNRRPRSVLRLALGLWGILLAFAFGACSDDSSAANSNDNQCNNTTDPVCGDGTLDSGEQCDDGVSNSDSSPDACRTSCRFAYCGDDVVDDGEVCDDGNSDDTDACLSTCALPTCGDGYTHQGVEACDTADPDNMALCTEDCVQDLATCSNNQLDPGEECDLGGANSDLPNSECRADCHPAYCGDGIQDDAIPNNELCDCGDDPEDLPAGCITINRDGVPNVCRLDCTLPVCGDGLLDSFYGEACDEGSDNCDDSQTCTCSTSCQLPSCGNGAVEDYLGEECDDGAGNCNDDGCECNTSCLVPGCGNGVADYGEVCDLGAGNCDDSTACLCASNCTIPACGNGVTESYRGEECDGAGTNCDVAGCTCNTVCTLPRCGNGHQEAAEECDHGDSGNCTDSPSCTCSTNCTVPACGNGVLEPFEGESCDLGAANCDSSGCACSTSCRIPWVTEKTGGVALHSVWTDGTDAIAVGNSGQAWHRNSSTGVWTLQTIPTSPAGAAFRGVHGTDANHVYAVGGSIASPELFEWNGAAWGDQWWGASFNQYLNGISCHNYASYPRCFIAADNSTVFDSQGNPGLSGPGPDFLAVTHYWASGTALYGWAVGGSGALAEYYSSSWHGGISSGTGVELRGVWAGSQNNVYAVGAAATVVRYTGAQWASVTGVPGSATLNGVVGVAANVYAVGNTGTILQFDGSAWSEETGMTTSNLNAVAGAGSLVIAVGDNGVILRRP